MTADVLTVPTRLLHLHREPCEGYKRNCLGLSLGRCGRTCSSLSSHFVCSEMFPRHEKVTWGNLTHH